MAALEPAVQIREERKSFSTAHLAEVLNLSVFIIRRWTSIGKLPAPSGNNNRYSTEDIDRVFNVLGFTPVPKLKKEENVNWQDTIESGLVLQENGVFVISPSANIDTQGIHEMIKKYGLWESQGLNNHSHIEDYAANPIHQLILAKELIDSWVSKSKALPLYGGKIVIYWNGSVSSTVCIYHMPKMDEDYLRKFDRYLGIKSLIVSER